MDKTLVNEVFLPSSRTLAASLDEPIETAVREFAAQPDVHTLFVVDGKRRLNGLVKLHYILNWVKLKLGMDVTDKSSIRFAGTLQAFEVVKLCQSQAISDIMSPAPSVKPDNTLEQALHIMVQEQQLELPVVDQAGTLLGEVRLTQILSRLLEVAPAAGSSCER